MSRRVLYGLTALAALYWPVGQWFSSFPKFHVWYIASAIMVAGAALMLAAAMTGRRRVAIAGSLVLLLFELHEIVMAHLIHAGEFRGHTRLVALIPTWADRLRASTDVPMIPVTLILIVASLIVSLGARKHAVPA